MAQRDAGGDGIRRSSRIPVLSCRLRDTDAVDRLSQIHQHGGEAEVDEGDEAQLRHGADVVVAQLQSMADAVGDDEVPRRRRGRQRAADLWTQPVGEAAEEEDGQGD